MLSVIVAQQKDAQRWDAFVATHASATVYHHFSFREIILQSFNRKPFYLMAVQSDSEVVGILPLILFTGIMGGNSLVSLPFFDGGGICASSYTVTQSLIFESWVWAKKLSAKKVEIRQEGNICGFDEFKGLLNIPHTQRSTKVRMLLNLPDTSTALFLGYPAKLRSQIRRPQKEGCRVVMGGVELVKDFYAILSRNMRDLGSPVEPKKAFYNVCAMYPKTKLFIVYYQEIPVACSLLFEFKDRVVNRWASSNRDYKKMAPNMLLYWSMLEYAIANGFKIFDFGRSSIGESTFKFKEQWGATPHPLVWYVFGSSHSVPITTKESFIKKTFISIWQKLPVPVATFFGSRLRRLVSL